MKFNVPFVPESTLRYMEQAISNGHLSGNGPLTQKCEQFLGQRLHADRVLLTHSCTAALEMAATLCDFSEGDEVILPSYTFVTTALAFVMQGATPIFVDIREDTLNIDESLVEAAITPRTKAIVVVHYAGVMAEMNSIKAIADRNNLILIEDAAQAITSTYNGQEACTFGHLATLSFHETKNISSGEGGALVINDPALTQRAEILREKGTNRTAFLNGEADKYTWIDKGSSYLPSEFIAAALQAQLDEIDAIQQRRLSIWNNYETQLRPLLNHANVKMPISPAHCYHNGHIFYLILENQTRRDQFISWMASQQIHCVFHYVPLHDSPAGKAYGRNPDPLPVTDDLSRRIVRLPLWLGIENDQDRVIKQVAAFFNQSR